MTPQKSQRVIWITRTSASKANQHPLANLQRYIATPRSVEKGTACPGSATYIKVVPSHLHFRPALVVMDGIKMSKESM